MCLIDRCVSALKTRPIQRALADDSSFFVVLRGSDKAHRNHYIVSKEKDRFAVLSFRNDSPIDEKHVNIGLLLCSDHNEL